MVGDGEEQREPVAGGPQVIANYKVMKHPTAGP